MPYTIQWKEKGLYWIYAGEVSDQEMLASYSDLYDDPRFLDIEYEIVDYLAVTSYDVSSDTIFKIAQMDKAASKRNPHVKVAVIADSQMIKGMSRMWQLAGGASVWESKIFDDGVAALEWVNQ